MQTRVLSTFSLLFASISAIIGSGWLFSAYYTSTLAGAGSILSWLIGGVGIMIVAFTFAELSAFVPVTGASIRIPRYTHGSMVGFVFAWILWLSYLALTAAEVQAMIQYCNFFFPGLVHLSGGLTGYGYMWASLLMLFITTINLYSLRWLISCNNVLTILKIIIPILIAAAVLWAEFSQHKLTLSAHNEKFLPFGFHGVLAAITSGGIVFAFNGFKQAAEMAGEAANPSRALPRAIVGSVLICLLIFLCLQVAFLSTIHSNLDLTFWKTIHVSGINSPFALILTQTHLTHLLPVLYVGAIIGPFAAGLMYCGSSARSLYAMSCNGSLSPHLQFLTKKGIPIKAIIVNYILAMCLFAPFPGWNSMANFLTSLMALAYATAPICVYTLRKRLGDQERFFKLPYANLWSFVAFYICSLLFYWSGWPIVSKFYIALLIGLGILFFYKMYNKKNRSLSLDWKEGAWMWPYFIGMTIISYYGSFNGKGVIPFGMDFIFVAVLSVFTMWFAGRCAFDSETIYRSLEEIKHPS